MDQGVSQSGTRRGVITVALQPALPGVLSNPTGGSVNWSTTIMTTGGLSQVQWTVIASDGAHYNQWSTVNLSGGQANIVAPFQASGDYVAVRLLSNTIVTAGAPFFLLANEAFNSRSSSATYFNSAGVLTTAGVDTARVTYDPVSLALLGTLIEPASTNTITNNSMVGAITGTPGTLPTGWHAFQDTGINLPQVVVGTGIESGIPYIDVQWIGIPGASGRCAIVFSPPTVVAALIGQPWTASLFCKIANGALTNALPVYNYTEVNAGNGSGLNNPVQVFVPTTAALASQRNSFTHTITATGAAFIASGVLINVVSGLPVNLTLRIGAPQLEQQAFVTSTILTTTAAVARAADAYSITSSSTPIGYAAVSGAVTLKVAAQATITLTPPSPGSLLVDATGGASWNTTVLTTGALTQVQWAVYTSAGAPRTPWNIVSLIGSSVALTVEFQANQDYLVVTQVGNPSIRTVSGAVTILGAAAATVAINPVQPGSIQADNVGGAPWTTEVSTSGGLTQVQWAVFSNTNVQRGNWAILNLTNGAASLSVEFLATGDYLEVTQVNNQAVAVISTAVTITTPVTTISLSPLNPGSLLADITGGAPWTTEVSATGGLTQVQWGIFDSTNTLYPPGWTVLNLTGGQAALTVEFHQTNDSLHVTEVGNPAIGVTSGFVTISPLSQPSLSLSPVNPGTIAMVGGVGVPWTTNVSASAGITQIQWQVFTVANAGRGSFQVLPLVNGNASLTVTFQATGDYLQVTQVGNTAIFDNSGPVIITDGAAGSAAVAISTSGVMTASSAAVGNITLPLVETGATAPINAAAGSAAVGISVQAVANPANTSAAASAANLTPMVFSASGFLIPGFKGASPVAVFSASGAAPATQTAHGTVGTNALSVAATAVSTNQATGTGTAVSFTASGAITFAATGVNMVPSAPGTLPSTNPTWQTTLSGSGGLTTVQTVVYNAAGTAYAAPASHFLTPLPIRLSATGDITLSSVNFGPFTTSTTVNFQVAVSVSGTLDFATFNGGVQTTATNSVPITNNAATIAATVFNNGDYVGVWLPAQPTHIAYTNPVVISTVVPPPAAPAPNTTVVTITFFNTGDYVVVSDPGNAAVHLNSSAVTISTTPSLSLSDATPGVLLAGEAWTTTITSIGMAKLQWSILNSSNVVQSGPTVVTLSGSGQQTTTITTSFQNTGDYLLVTNSPPTGVSIQSQGVTIAPAQALTLGPVNPGTLSVSHPIWTTQLTAVPPLAQAQWAVFNAAGVNQTGWTVINLAEAGTSFTAVFQNTGDYVQATPVGVTAPVATSGTVTLTAGQAIHLVPPNPGTLPAGVLTWATQVVVLNGGAPVFAQVNFSTPASGATVNSTFGNANSAGNTIVGLIGWNDSTSTLVSVTDTLGNSYAISQTTRSTGNASQAIFTAMNIKAGTNTVTATFSGSVNFPDLRVAEYSNVVANHGSAGGAGNSATASLLIAVQAGDLVVGGAYVQSGVSGAPAGWANEVITAPDADNLQDSIAVSTSTLTVSANLTGAGWWVINAITLGSAAASGMPLPTSVQWAIFNGNVMTSPGWSTLALTVGSGTAVAPLNVTFSHPGDYVVVRELAPNDAIATASGPFIGNAGSGSINAAGVTPSPVDMTNWTLVFEDDFTGTTLNAAWWDLYGNSGNAAGTSVVWDNAGLVVNNGLQSSIFWDGTNWRGGGMQNGGTQFSGNGFFNAPNANGLLPYRAEVKAYVPYVGNGGNAAFGPYFLMWPWNNVWGNEFDIAEYIFTGNNQTIATWHWNADNAPDDSFVYGINNSTVYHVYTVECNPANTPQFRVWMDGTEVLGLPADWDANKAAQPMVFGMGSVGAPANLPAGWGTQPITSFISYVRMWQPAATSPSTDLQKAQAFVANLKIGANVERQNWNSLSYNGVAIANSQAYWNSLAAMGLTHIRFFINYGFSGAGSLQSQAAVNSFQAPISLAINAGLKVIFELADVVNYSDYTGNSAAFQAWWSACGSTIAAWNLDKTKFAVGPINEYAFDNNADWNPVMATGISILRSKLPGYILWGGGANWKYYGGAGSLNSYDNAAGLTDGTFTPVSDMLVVYDVHNYDVSTGFGSAGFTTATSIIAAWQNANGHRPVVFGEVGGNGTLTSSWQAADITSWASGGGQYAPTLWTITNGSDGRLNNSASDATITPANAAAITSAGNTIAAASYFGNGTIR